MEIDRPIINISVFLQKWQDRGVSFSQYEAGQTLEVLHRQMFFFLALLLRKVKSSQHKP